MTTPRTGARLVGVALDVDAFERELAARGLEARDLARIAKLKSDTLTRARHGERVTRDTLMRISDALLKIPVHPVAAALTGSAITPTTRTTKKNAADNGYVSAAHRRLEGRVSATSAD